MNLKVKDSFGDDVFSPEEVNYTNSSSPTEREFTRNSSLKLSGNSRKGKFSDYFCGLKKKKSKEVNLSSDSTTTPMSDSQTPISKSNFYCDFQQCATPDESHNSSNSGSNGSGVSSHSTPSKRELKIEEKIESINKFNLRDNSCKNTMSEFSRSIGDDETTESDGDVQEVDNVSSTFPFYTLTVHLSEGKDLVIKDKTGSSDPYVKVKAGDKTLYKSKVIYANLNPIWDETFTLPIHDIKEPLIFKVIDYDWGSKDDFMGMCIINLQKLPTTGTCQHVNLSLSKKGIQGEKSMGQLLVSLNLVPRTAEEKHIWMTESVTSQAQMKMQKQTWNGTLTVLLIDVQDLPLRRDSTSDTAAGSSGIAHLSGYSNVFAKLRLGTQKRRSKHVMEIANRPEWLEQFDFYLYEANSGQTSIFEIEILEESSVGRIPLGFASLDISQLQKDKTKELFLNFTNGLGRVRVGITASGFRSISSESSPGPRRDVLLEQYCLGNSFKIDSIRDVGQLTVKVIQAEGLRAADMGGKSDPFCVLELINARVQTHTEYKTLTPIWNHSFHFLVSDITSKLEVTVYDEDRDHKRDFLGKINIPLWKIQNGEQIWYKLKNRNLAKGARGNNPKILLQMDLAWNPIRAAVRVTEPQEMKYCQPKPQLKIETFLINMERLRLVLMDAYDFWLYLKSCLDWEYPERSIKALMIYLLTCYFFQPFFIPLYFLLFWLRPWWRSVTSNFTLPPVSTSKEIKESRIDGNSSSQLIRSNAHANDTLNLDESDDDEDEIKTLTLIEKLTILQDASGVLQELLGEVAAICESTVNTYRMVVPFIYWLFIILFAAATMSFILIDFRYIAMIFGIHEFSRVYLRPWKQSTFELYHMIRRVPHQMNLGDKLGINSVVKSIQQLKSSNRQKFRKLQKSPSPQAISSQNSPAVTGTSAWYVQQEGEQ